MSLLYSSPIPVPGTRTKPPKKNFSMVIRFGRLSSLPERDAQYHRAKSLTSAFRWNGTAFIQNFDRRVNFVGIETASSLSVLDFNKSYYKDHRRFPQLQRFVLVSQISFRKRISDLLNFILVPMSTRHESIAFRNAMKLSFRTVVQF